ncbi:MAG TPA: beta-ketoacyl-ACP synthase II [Acidimicrobiales bacterium]|jgi:3-oxoacyl-[acyl-carrier-protein] synthase II|nr:beta-ketoacyl-ACP synthase II [Acidimicrobiales bacterium]
MLLGIGENGPIAGRRVAITGIGVVSCCGVGTDALWTGLNGPPPEGERRVPGFDPEQWFGPKEVRQIDRFAQFGVAASELALEDAGELGVDPDRAGVIMGTGVGGFESLQTQVLVYGEKGARRVSPRLVPMMMSNAGAANVSMRAGWHGPSEAIVTACAAGTHSIGYAARLVASGRLDVAIGGGTEAAMTEVGIAAFANMTALSSSGISRPFDARRDGFVITEGAGALVLEAWDHAVARGARIYGELAGSASTADAHHITAPIPGGAGAVTCMIMAMEDAGASLGDIGHINAHGTSTPLNDQAEADAITKVFGAEAPPVTSTKGITGHGLGAAGAIEAVAAVLSIKHRLIPPTSGYEQPDPDIHLDIVAGEARPWEPGAVLSNSFGFGGHNGCLVITPG